MNVYVIFNMILFYVHRICLFIDCLRFLSLNIVANVFNCFFLLVFVNSFAYVGCFNKEMSYLILSYLNSAI